MTSRPTPPSLSSSSSSFSTSIPNKFPNTNIGDKRYGDYDEYANCVAGYGCYEETNLDYISGYNHDNNNEEVILCDPVRMSQYGFLILLTGTIVGLGFLIVTALMAGRRKRDINSFHLKNRIPSLLIGLEDFEEKVDRIASGQSMADDSWISSLFHKFKNLYGKEEIVDNQGDDGLEPPMLDETWGLADTFLFKDDQNTTELNTTNDNTTESILEASSNKVKRSIDGHEKISDKLGFLDTLFGDNEKCKVQYYKCVADVVQNGMEDASSSGGVYNYIQKFMFKIAFNKNYGNGFWEALMSVPEARALRRCLNAQDECQEIEILKKESNSEDENPRVIINPEYVESLDKSDGSTQFDPENEPDYY